MRSFRGRMMMAPMVLPTSRMEGVPAKEGDVCGRPKL